MKPIDRDPVRFPETAFMLQEDISGYAVGDRLRLGERVRKIKQDSQKNRPVGRMHCLRRTGKSGFGQQPEYEKISDPRLEPDSLGEEPSLKELKLLPHIPDGCFDCEPTYNLCLILQAYQSEIRARIQALEGK